MKKRYRLIKGDCVMVMPNFDFKVDMILADLPYGTTACKWDTVIPFWLLWSNYKNLIKPNGAIVLTASQPFTSALVMSNPKWFRYCYCWIKNTQTGIGLANYQPMRKHEDVCVFYGESSTFNKQPNETESAAVRAMASRGTKRVGPNTATEHLPGMSLVRKPFATSINPSTVLRFDVVANRDSQRVHRTQKPVALMEYLIRTYTNEGETVLDNTMGSGTTGVACMNTGRQFIGIEKDPEYFQIAVRRIKEAALLTKGGASCPI